MDGWMHVWMDGGREGRGKDGDLNQFNEPIFVSCAIFTGGLLESRPELWDGHYNPSLCTDLQATSSGFLMWLVKLGTNNFPRVTAAQPQRVNIKLKFKNLSGIHFRTACSLGCAVRSDVELKNPRVCIHLCIYSVSLLREVNLSRNISLFQGHAGSCSLSASVPPQSQSQWGAH